MNLRNANLIQLKSTDCFDVLIVGAGINGAVAASALAAKGVKVALIDRGDFGGETSSNSSNLAWGGIKYLESHEFFLVNKLCSSRNHLMRSYPSTVKEVRFLTTVSKGFRFPIIMVYLGTLLYWLMGRFFTRFPEILNVKSLNNKEPIINTTNVRGGIEYSDAYLYDNDARFVFNFVRSAMDHGCIAVNYLQSTVIKKQQDYWQVNVEDMTNNSSFTIKAKVLINACGPWLDEHNQKASQATQHRHIFSKGIHLIVPKLTKEKRILTFFASDGRMFFAIPMGNRTCVGTTDVIVDTPEVDVNADDRHFVLNNINTLVDLDKPLTEADIIAERCGVRPLAVTAGNNTTDWTKLSRKHVIECNLDDRHLSIFGGKLTDCINVGNEVIELVEQLGITIPFKHYVWYGEDDESVYKKFCHQAQLMSLDSYTVEGSSELLSQRLWRRYGGNALKILENIRQDSTQAQRLMNEAEYLRCEVEYTAKHEMITKLDDFLRRRSKITQVVSVDDIKDSQGLKEACKLFFGSQAETKYQEWLHGLN